MLTKEERVSEICYKWWYLNACDIRNLDQCLQIWQENWIIYLLFAILFELKYEFETSSNTDTELTLCVIKVQNIGIHPYLSVILL